MTYWYRVFAVAAMPSADQFGVPGSLARVKVALDWWASQRTTCTRSPDPEPDGSVGIKKAAHAVLLFGWCVHCGLREARIEMRCDDRSGNQAN